MAASCEIVKTMKSFSKRHFDLIRKFPMYIIRFVLNSSKAKQICIYIVYGTKKTKYDCTDITIIMLHEFV